MDEYFANKCAISSCWWNQIKWAIVVVVLNCYARFQFCPPPSNTHNHTVHLPFFSAFTFDCRLQGRNVFVYFNGNTICIALFIAFVHRIDRGQLFTAAMAMLCGWSETFINACLFFFYFSLFNAIDYIRHALISLLVRVTLAIFQMLFFALFHVFVSLFSLSMENSAVMQIENKIELWAISIVIVAPGQLPCRFVVFIRFQ